MKKWTKFITLTSVVVLASASPLTALADENIPATADVPAVSSVPEAPSDSSSAPSDDTVIPTVPETSTEVPSTPEVNTVVPTDPNVTVPSTSEPVETSPATEVTPPSAEEPSQTTPEEPSQTTPEENSSTEPSSTEKPEQDADETSESKTSEPTENTVTVPTVDGGSATVIPDVNVPTNNPKVTAQTAVNAGASQVGTTSTVTGQVVSNVTPSAPVYTDTGYQIVDTKNSQVVVVYSDGSTATVAPEVVGGKVNEDKTITVTDQSGSKKTLPHTGEESGVLASIGTAIFAGLVAYFLKKRTLKSN
ncbi:LPXTG cell wall anchor domain-containing protein [Streptococcus rifensis]